MLQTNAFNETAKNGVLECDSYQYHVTHQCIFEERVKHQWDELAVDLQKHGATEKDITTKATGDDSYVRYANP